MFSMDYFMPSLWIASTESVSGFILLMALILGSVVLVSLVLVRFRQSLLVAYFLCGIFLSHSGLLSLSSSHGQDAIPILAEMGVILLLFTLGIEFSLDSLKQLRHTVLLGGSIQMFLVVLLAAPIMHLVGFGWSQSIALGLTIALSSTAVALKSFQDMKQPDSPQARTALSIFIYQDIAAILIIVLLPGLLGEGNIQQALFASLLKGGGFCCVMVMLSRWGIPHFLESIIRTRSRELFTIAVLALCMGIAMFSDFLGLSPALGAFGAGLVVSRSFYSHRVLADILPFKDLFLTLFFVSIGLLIDLNTVAEQWPIILAAGLGILMLKGICAAIAARACGLRMGSWLVTAASLANTSEFSFVLLNKMTGLGVLSPALEQTLLVCMALTMGLTPSLMQASVKGMMFLRKRGGKYMKTSRHLSSSALVEALESHVIICGFGPVGEHLYNQLHHSDVRSVILEMNAKTVKKLLGEGMKCLFADASQKASLELARIEKARAIAFTFPSAEVVLSALPSIFEGNPSIIVCARVKFAKEAEKLLAAGVHHVILDEEESGKRMVSDVLGCFSRELAEDIEEL